MSSDDAPVLGHFARSNEQIENLRADGSALIVFTGRHGYISPSILRDRTQAPTWNYESIHLRAEIELLPDPNDARRAVTARSQHMEAGRHAWKVGEMGQRFGSLAKGVIAFRAHLRETVAVFKLGQNESAGVFSDMIAGMIGKHETSLREAIGEAAHWIRDDLYTA